VAERVRLAIVENGGPETTAGRWAALGLVMAPMATDHEEAEVEYAWAIDFI
jgi:hypothetical protein